jgi:hypothetical protein
MKPVVSIACALGLLIVVGCGEDNGFPPSQNSQRDTLEITFQDGIHPYGTYFGTRDAVIKDGPKPEFVFGNFGAAVLDTLGTVYAGNDYYERRLLVRMDLSDLSGCAAVLDARLTLHIESQLVDSLVLEAYEVEVPPVIPGSWEEGTGGLYGGVSWNAADGAVPWSTPGGDVAYPPVDTQTVRADSVVTFSLPGGLVLRWIHAPLSNHGVLIKAAGTSGERFVLVHSRESRTPTYRPRLEILYFKSG